MLPIWSFYGNETWCMIGYHAVSVLADMIVKGVKGFDYERAYEAMKTTAMNPNYDCLPDQSKSDKRVHDSRNNGNHPLYPKPWQPVPCNNHHTHIPMF